MGRNEKKSYREVSNIMDHLLDQLHNLHLGHMSIQNFIVIFEDLTCRCDVREHCSQTIIRFVSSLRSKIKRAMFTSSHDVDTLEEAFDFALKIDLTFKGLLIAKPWEQCSKCEGYGD